MPTTTPVDPRLLHDLALANRVLAAHGVVDAMGHVSVRDPHDPDQFLISRSLAPEMVAERDIQRFTLDGEEVTGDTRPAYAERAIHAAVYRARPDVLSVCHNHAPSIIPFAATGVPLRPIFHMAALLGTDVPIWDPQPDFGDTDMLVRSREQGDSLARTLGPRAVALMRGHGSVVAGPSLREVVLCAVYMEQNARMEAPALGLSRDVRFLTDGEIERASRDMCKIPLVQERTWGAWTRRVEFAPEP